MPTMKEINDLASRLHDKKVINLDTSARDILSAASLHNHAQEVGIYVLGGDHYVVVCGAVPGKSIDPGRIVNP